MKAEGVPPKPAAPYRSQNDYGLGTSPVSPSSKSTNHTFIQADAM